MNFLYLHFCIMSYSGSYVCYVLLVLMYALSSLISHAFPILFTVNMEMILKIMKKISVLVKKRWQQLQWLQLQLLYLHSLSLLNQRLHHT